MKLDQSDVECILVALEGFNTILNEGTEVTTAVVSVNDHAINIEFDDGNWHIINIKEYDSE